MKKLASFVMAVMLIVSLLVLPACSAQSGSDADETIVIGTLPTEDFLPFWVAADAGEFERAGLDVKLETFQSAQELSVAITSGEVDMAMTDVSVAASLTAGGTPMTIEWVTLGASPSEGRFGIMTAPDSGYSTLGDLAGVPVAVGSNTVPEYVFDKLMEGAGVAPADIVTEEVKKLPVRFEMMTSGQVAAAALPASLLALGEENGMVLIADDTNGANISQSIMAATSAFADSETGAADIETLGDIWDASVYRISSDPESYRSLLVAQANLSEAIASSYPISAYPLVSMPDAAYVDDMLSWMDEKGYLTSRVSYSAQTGKLEAA